VQLDIINSFKQFEFEEADVHVWLPLDKIVLYNPDQLETNIGRFGLLHEISHGLLGHRFYTYDTELLKMEREAWDQALILAPDYKVTPDHHHIAACLQTYAAWHEQRALCPDCQAYGVQQARNRFSCIECGAHWKTNDRKNARVQRRRLAIVPTMLISD
jgi:hypothetical protein